MQNLLQSDLGSNLLSISIILGWTVFCFSKSIDNLDKKNIGSDFKNKILIFIVNQLSRINHITLYRLSIIT